MRAAEPGEVHEPATGAMHPRGQHVWLLAPTWIAVNALDRPVVQPVAVPVLASRPAVPGPVPACGGFSADADHRSAAVVVGDRLRAGLFYWGNRFKSMRRTTIIFYGILGGASMLLGGARRSTTRLPDCADRAARGRASRSRRACSCSPARRPPRSACWPTCPSASRPTAARSWASTACSSAIGQIIGSLIGGAAAELLGIDGLLFATRRPARHRARSRWRCCAPGARVSSRAPSRARRGARRR